MDSVSEKTDDNNTGFAKNPRDEAILRFRLEDVRTAAARPISCSSL